MNGIPIRPGLPEPPQAAGEFYLIEGTDVYLPPEVCCHLAKIKTGTEGIVLDRPEASCTPLLPDYNPPVLVEDRSGKPQNLPPQLFFTAQDIAV